jgi:uncharacterized protein (TIGR02453 family)
MKKVFSFPQITEKFLSDLSKHNNKEWFEKNRDRFDFEFLQPAVQFVSEMGEKLSEIIPNINAVPKIDKSIFRLHRDVRFSKDKSPFKSNLGLYFWEGKGKRMECAGFYFHIEPQKIFLGGGMYVFTKEQLKKYRDVVADPGKAKELISIIKGLEKKKLQIGGKKYKNVPRNYDPDYKYKDLWLHEGVYAFSESQGIDKAASKDILNNSFKVFKQMVSLHKWLVKNIT